MHTATAQFADADRSCSRIDAIDAATTENLNSRERRAMRQIVPIWGLSAQEIWQTAYAPIRIVVRHQNDHLLLRFQFLDAQRGTYPCVTPTDY
jgi:hypothetical protein